jgi:hypothetical protein
MTRAYDIDPVCERLSVKRRFLMEWLRRHPWDDCGQPFYSAIAGKRKLFTDADVAVSSRHFRNRSVSRARQALPADAKHPTFRIRGTHLGQHVDRSTGLRERKAANKLLAKWRDDIERGVLARKDDPTFASASIS